MERLKWSCNGKTKSYKTHKNAFGLNYGAVESGGTCPGSTVGKGGCCNVPDGHKRQTCYVAKITQIYPSVGKILDDNTELLKNKSYEEMIVILKDSVEEFRKLDKGRSPYLRLHWSGDFFSKTYALAWVKTIKDFPDVRFWAYTRTIDVVPLFAGIPNMSLYISADPVNKDKALEMFERYKSFPNIGISFMGDSAPTDDGMRWVTCPETSGKLKNTSERGACAKCRLCIDNYKTRLRNIQFLIH